MVTRYKNLVLVGTSHIARHSIKDITEAVEAEKPKVIAVELDRRRLHALLSDEKPKMTFSMVRKVGLKGFLFAMLGSWVQRKLGKIVGVEPGADMLTAVRLAQKGGIRLALIDQDIEITLRKFSQALSWRERFRFFGDLLRATFFQRREMRRLGLDKLDLTRVPPKYLVQRLTKELHDRYPNIYRVLIEERNQVMAERLHQVMGGIEGDVLAVVGAGHEDDLLGRIRALEEDVTYEFNIGQRREGPESK